MKNIISRKRKQKKLFAAIKKKEIHDIIRANELNVRLTEKVWFKPIWLVFCFPVVGLAIDVFKATSILYIYIYLSFVFVGFTMLFLLSQQPTVQFIDKNKIRQKNKFETFLIVDSRYTFKVMSSFSSFENRECKEGKRSCHIQMEQS